MENKSDGERLEQEIKKIIRTRQYGDNEIFENVSADRIKSEVFKFLDSEEYTEEDIQKDVESMITTLNKTKDGKLRQRLIQVLEIVEDYENEQLGYDKRLTREQIRELKANGIEIEDAEYAIALHNYGIEPKNVVVKKQKIKRVTINKEQEKEAKSKEKDEGEEERLEDGGAKQKSTIKVQYNVNTGEYSLIDSKDGKTIKKINALDKNQRKVNKGIQKYVANKYSLSKEQLKYFDSNVYNLLKEVKKDEEYIYDISVRVNTDGEVLEKKETDKYSIEYNLKTDKTKRKFFRNPILSAKIRNRADNQEKIKLATVTRDKKKSIWKGLLIGLGFGASVSMIGGGIKLINDSRENKVRQENQVPIQPENTSQMENDGYGSLDMNETQEGNIQNPNIAEQQAVEKPVQQPVQINKTEEQGQKTQENAYNKTSGQQEKNSERQYVSISSGATMFNDPVQYNLYKNGIKGGEIPDIKSVSGGNYYITGKCYFDKNGNSIEFIKDENEMYSSVKICGTPIEIDSTDSIENVKEQLKKDFRLNVDDGQYTEMNHVVAIKNQNGQYTKVEGNNRNMVNISTWVPNEYCIPIEISKTTSHKEFVEQLSKYTGYNNTTKQVQQRNSEEREMEL